MSQESVAQVITKALTDAEFRSQLLAEPSAALSGYDLTEEEQASLSRLQEEALDAFASEVEERISKMSPLAGFDPLEHYAGVQMKEGSVALDQDWNEGVAVMQGASDPQHLIRAELISPEDLSRLLSLSDGD